MATFPTSLFTWTTRVDNVDNVLATDPNSLAAEIIASETKIGISSSGDTTSLDYFLRHASGNFRTHVHAGGANDGANIPDTSLNQIATAGKVSGAALTLLANIPSGAGVIPAANLTSVAQKGANSDITSLSGLTGQISQLIIENRTDDTGCTQTGRLWLRTNV